MWEIASMGISQCVRVRFYVDVDNLYWYWNVRHKTDTNNVINFLITLFQQLKLSAQRFRYALSAFIHTQTYFEYYTLTLRLASLVKKAVIYAYWTKELFDICRENVSYMATLPSVARHVIHADNLRPRH